MIPLFFLFLLALEDAVHSISGAEWLGFWAAALILPIALFHAVKWAVNLLVTKARQ